MRSSGSDMYFLIAFTIWIGIKNTNNKDCIVLSLIIRFSYWYSIPASIAVSFILYRPLLINKPTSPQVIWYESTSKMPTTNPSPSRLFLLFCVFLLSQISAGNPAVFLLSDILPDFWLFIHFYSLSSYNRDYHTNLLFCFVFTPNRFLDQINSLDQHSRLLNIPHRSHI